ncbi:MAG: hypothetical protein AAGA10_14070 [Bacteroidota bacterium]
MSNLPLSDQWQAFKEQSLEEGMEGKDLASYLEKGIRQYRKAYLQRLYSQLGMYLFMVLLVGGC